ncbi:hypothetical protein GCM10009548_27320 [Streptomyces malaysiensis subsp. malaysiensis]
MLIAAMRFGAAFSGVLPCSWATVRGKSPSAAEDPGAFETAEDPEDPEDPDDPEDADDDAGSEDPQPVRTVAARTAESRGNRRRGPTSNSNR